MHDDSLAVALLNLNLAMKISREIDPNIHSRRLASLSRPRSSNEQSAKEATVVARRRRRRSRRRSRRRRRARCGNRDSAAAAPPRLSSGRRGGEGRALADGGSDVLPIFA